MGKKEQKGRRRINEAAKKVFFVDRPEGGGKRLSTKEKKNLFLKCFFFLLNL